MDMPKMAIVSANRFAHFCKTTLAKTFAETIAWVGMVLIMCSPLPSIIALMTGVSETHPPIDLVLLVWGGMSLFFVRSVIVKNMMHVATIGGGFVVHTVLLSLIVFK